MRKATVQKAGRSGNNINMEGPLPPECPPLTDVERTEHRKEGKRNEWKP